jgi:hypothetical protein
MPKSKNPSSSKVNAGEQLVKFVKRYLKGCGVSATSGNVNKVLNSMTAEGVVFEARK